MGGQWGQLKDPSTPPPKHPPQFRASLPSQPSTLKLVRQQQQQLHRRLDFVTLPQPPPTHPPPRPNPTTAPPPLQPPT